MFNCTCETLKCNQKPKWTRRQIPHRTSHLTQVHSSSLSGTASRQVPIVFVLQFDFDLKTEGYFIRIPLILSSAFMIKIKLYFQQNFEAGFEALKMSIKATFNVSVLSKLRLTMLHIPTYKIEKKLIQHMYGNIPQVGICLTTRPIRLSIIIFYVLKSSMKTHSSI